MAQTQTLKCECGNPVEPEETKCEWCYAAEAEDPHTGHYSLFGTYWCDTCDSPYCNLI